MIIDDFSNPKRKLTVSEASAANDYFTRRKSEEDRIAGVKAPAKNKKNPANTDYAKKRKQQDIEESRPFRGTGGAFNRGDDERHDLDPSDWYKVKDGKMFAASIYPRQVAQAEREGYSRTQAEAKAAADSQGAAEGSGGNWYIRVNGKILNDTKFKPMIFSSEDEARSYAMKLADKKRIPLSQIKLTKSWMDAPEQGVAEGSSYKIDQDDHDEFTQDEIVRIKNSHFPDTLRDNLRAAKKEARRAKHFSSSSDGGDSKLGSPVGSASDNTYEGVAEGSELKQAKRKYNQAAKDANLDQVGAGKKIDTMKNSLRQKDLNKQGMAEGLPGSLSKSDYTPGATKKHVNTNCTTCHGRKGMYKLDGKLFADNKVGAVRVKCPTCKGTGDKQSLKENAEDLHIGDPVIITGNGIEFEGATGEIINFGQQHRFVVVDLYNHGRHSFHSSDVSFNEYAGSDDEEARMYDAGEFGNDYRDEMDEAEEPMQSPEQIAYNQLRAQWDGYQAMTSGGGNTYVSRDPAHAAKLATIPAQLAKMSAALKAKGINAEADYNAIGGPKAAPVDINQQYVDEVRMSAAQRLSNAWDKQRAKSDASLRRTPSSIPKKEEPKKADPVPKTVSEHRAQRRALMAQMLNSH